MFADKTLLLKGLAGVAALGGVVGGGYAAHKGGLFSSSSNASADKPQSEKKEDSELAQQNAEEIKKQKEAKKTEINEKLKTLGLDTSCHLEIDNFSSSTAFSKECELNQSKLESIKFSNKAENSNVTVNGLTGNIKLKISNRGDDKVSYKLSGASSKITISGDAEKGKITLPQAAEREFEENTEGKLSKVPASGATDTATLNQKIKKLGFSNKCWFEEGENETSVECTLDKTEFQKIPFSNKGNTDVTVEGLTDGGSIKLKIEKKQGENNKLGYKFSGASSKITISGEAEKGKITLPPTEEREFEEKEEGKLSKVSASSNASTFNQKIKNLKIPNNCLFEEGENETSVECTLNKTELQKIPFSNKGNTDVTVEGLDNGNIKLKIEKKDNNSELGFTFSDITSKLTIKGDQTKANITLKPNETREFEEKDSKLKKVPKNSNKSNIQGANTKLGTIKIPDWCRFEEEDNETSLECDLSNLEDLKKIEFYNRESSNQMTIVGSTGNLKLKVNRFENKEGEKKYQTGVDLEFFFSGYSQEVKIQGATSASTNDIVLKANTNTPLTISSQNKLAKAINSSMIDGKLNLSCTKDTTNTLVTSFKCTPLQANKKIKVLNTENGNVEEIDVGSGDTNTQILTTTENTANYELGIKFTVIQDYPSSSPKLTKNSTYEAKYIKDKGGWLLVKKG